jgi:hypothetical protein
MPWTDRHVVRSSCAALVPVILAHSHAAWSSNALVNRDPGRAHGTAATTTMSRAGHPGCPGLQEAAHRARIQRPLPATALPGIAQAAPSPAPRAAVPVTVIGPDAEHQRLLAARARNDVAVLEHQVPDSQQLLP